MAMNKKTKKTPPRKMMNPKTEATASSILACSNPHVSSKSNSDFVKGALIETLQQSP